MFFQRKWKVPLKRFMFIPLLTNKENDSMSYKVSILMFAHVYTNEI